MGAVAVAFALVGAAALAACDEGKQRNQKVRGPLVSVVESNVGPDRPLPANGVVKVRVDRYLLPASISRQAFALSEAGGAPITENYLVSYDPVALTVTLSPEAAGQAGPDRKWLKLGQPYVLRFPVADDNPQNFGLRAIDGATIDPKGLREIAFTVSKDSAPDAEVRPPTIDYCRDVQPVLYQKCGAGSPCHASADTSAAGLFLTTPDGVRYTALRKGAAHGANTGARAAAVNPGRVFGVDMPLVDPGQSANSWLLYKVLLAPLPAEPGTSTALCPNPSGAPPKPPLATTGIGFVQPDGVEQAALADYVPGREMPYPGNEGYVGQGLTYEERQRLRLWIDQGAKVDGCFQCSYPSTPSDGGADGAGPSDAGAD